MNTLEQKEKFINDFQNQIEVRLTKNLTTTISTCNYSNWSKEEYVYMPEVANRLRAKGYTVTSQIKWGVTDWSISV